VIFVSFQPNMIQMYVIDTQNVHILLYQQNDIYRYMFFPYFSFLFV